MKIKSLAAMVAIVVAGSLARPALAQDHHADETAYEVQMKANAVAWEMYRYHRHQHDFREAYAEAREMYAIARDLHSLLHDRISSSRVERNARELDEAYHHLEEHVGGWQGTGHQHGYHYHHTRSIEQLNLRMRALGDALHHLLEDLGIEIAPVGSSSGPVDDGSLPPDVGGGALPSIRSGGSSSGGSLPPSGGSGDFEPSGSSGDFPPS